MLVLEILVRLYELYWLTLTLTLLLPQLQLPHSAAPTATPAVKASAVPAT
jgi:hypothetical protein